MRVSRLRRRRRRREPFLDWAIPQMTFEEIAYLGRTADVAVRAVHRIWERVAHSDNGEAELAGNPLAWRGSAQYLQTAHRTMERRVRQPLRQRGISVSA
jgi:hypothetical protein